MIKSNFKTKYIKNGVKPERYEYCYIAYKSNSYIVDVLRADLRGGGRYYYTAMP